MQEREARLIEKELIKHAKAAEKQKQREAKEQRAHKKQAMMTTNMPEIMAIQKEARRIFKANWTTSTCEEQGQKLHDRIKEGYASLCQAPYLGKQPLAYKRNQDTAIAKLKAKRARGKYGTPLPSFEPPLVLPHFHGMREPLLAQGFPWELVRSLQFPPWVFCTTPPNSHQLLFRGPIVVTSPTSSVVLERHVSSEYFLMSAHD